MARNLLARLTATSTLATLVLAGCPGKDGKPGDTTPPDPVVVQPDAEPTAVDPGAAAPTVDDALAFLARTEEALKTAWIEQGRADWVNANFITDDTDALSAAAGVRSNELITKAIQESVKYRG